jgi:tetratricopeptide (TPR) repeat protein
MSIRNHFIAGVIALAGSLVIAGPAPAAESQAWTWCVNRNNAYSPDLAIGGCTTVIQSGKETKGNLSIAFKNRGVAHYHAHDYDRAIADADQAIKLNPKYAPAFIDRGNSHHAKQEYNLAIADYTEAIRIDPKYAIAYKNRGDIHYAKKDCDRAFADQNIAIRLNPKYTNAYIDRGVSYYVKKDYDHAIADYSEAIKLSPKDALAYNDRGNAYYAKHVALAKRSAINCNEMPRGGVRPFLFL